MEELNWFAEQIIMHWYSAKEIEKVVFIKESIFGNGHIFLILITLCEWLDQRIGMSHLICDFYAENTE